MTALRLPRVSRGGAPGHDGQPTAGPSDGHVRAARHMRPTGGHRAAAGLAALAAAAVLSFASQVSAEDGPFRIGVIVDMSGVYASNGGPGAVVATKMAVQDFGGKVLGRPIEVLSADYQNKAEVASSIVRKWFDVDNANMVIESTDSSAALAMQRIGQEHKRITISAGSATDTLTNKACSPYGIHYVYDTYSLATGAARAIVGKGGKTWYFIGADYAFGHALESETAETVQKLGGKVLGVSWHPLSTSDFAAYLLAAQSSGAHVVGFANSGTDTSNAVKQAVEFGLPKSGQKLAGLLMFNTDVKALGLPVVQGMEFVTSYDWNFDDQTRVFGKRFYEQFHAMPTMIQAGIYSAVQHYLHAVQEVGTADSDKVMARLRATKFDDFFARHGHLREDGLMVHDMFLAEAKTPQESSGPWDLVNILKVIPGDEAYASLADSQCPLVKK